ncbi:hypothetical protein [Microbacterium sp. MPKO10]|uniref:hypothetical protein n=1 Tax=Microbacterium sp. MPKO10 TaxID=2989818 RepID=UPI002235E7E3|nr:hypothetical protein [Microbacterium sp. MPKO10]MCW4457988.1 hypothetical protein [Microbacterium sp. MPKO10]
MLLWLVAVVAAGGLVFVVIAALMGTQITGVLMVTLLLAGVVVVLVFARRRQRANGEKERLDVWIGQQGLMLRGVGPVPWHGFGPAHHDRRPPRDE